MPLGGANNMRPLSWGGGGTNGKDPNKDVINLLQFEIYLRESMNITFRLLDI